MIEQPEIFPIDIQCCSHKQNTKHYIILCLGKRLVLFPQVGQQSGILYIILRPDQNSLYLSIWREMQVFWIYNKQPIIFHKNTVIYLLVKKTYTFHKPHCTVTWVDQTPEKVDLETGKWRAMDISFSPPFYLVNWEIQIRPFKNRVIFNQFIQTWKDIVTTVIEDQNQLI